MFANVRKLVALDGLAAVSTLALVAAPPPSRHLFADPDALALVVAWATALAAALHLTVTLTWCIAAIARGQPAAAFGWSTRVPSALRPWVELAIAGALVTLPAAPARAASVRDTPVVRVPVVAADIPVLRAPPAPTPPTSTPPAPTRRPVPVARQHVVQPGDNLWRIARDTLASAGRPTAAPADVAPYWQRVVAANRPTLRSGNPNLIFPGEIVTLPPIL